MNPARPIEAVTFDVGGTLIEPWPSVGHVYASVAAKHGRPRLDPETLNRQFRQAWKSKSGFDYSKLAWAELAAKTFADPGNPAQPLPFFEELYRRFASPEVWQIHSDVFPTLHLLEQKGVRLGIISNWDERLPDLLRGLGLSHYFAVEVISFQTGSTKPDPAIFQVASDRLEMEPGRVLHVGDSADEDQAGAVSAGMQARLLDRSAPELKEGLVRSLLEVRDLFDG